MIFAKIIEQDSNNLSQTNLIKMEWDLDGEVGTWGSEY